jgi:hypothetical protein
MAMAGGYPFGLEVDDPQPQNRLSVLLRIFYVIPQIIVMYFIMLAAGIVGIVAWLMILFTGKYPGGMANFSVGAMRWSNRVSGYMFLLTDKYPPFSLDAVADYPVRFDGTVALDGRNRLTCFFRYFMIIPHIIVLALVGIAAEVVLLIAWFVALFTGSVPPGLHTFLAGTLRWSARVNAYYLLLTDEYPPFSLS